jgi:plastocyanin
MHRRSFRRLCLLAIAIAGISVGACGGDDEEPASGSGSGSQSGSGGSSGGGGGGGEKLSLAAAESGGLSFDKKKLSAKAGEVTITLDNPASDQLPHAIAVEGGGVDESGDTVQPGEKSTVTADLEAGKYTFYCPVGNHRQSGMEGTLTVR